MEKVKLTSEQAGAIEKLKQKANHSNSTSVLMYINDVYESEILNNLGIDGVIRALYVGYEEELTPEERILHMYNKWDIEDVIPTIIEEKWIRGFRTGIIRTLQELNIEIEGINK